DVSDLTTLRQTHAHGTRFSVETCDGHTDQFAVATACGKRGLDKRAEVARTGVDKPPTFICSEISNDSCVDFSKWFDSAPSVVRVDATLVEGMIERSIEDSEH